MQTLRGDVTLTTARFVLKPLDETDADDLLAHFSDPRVMDYMDIDPLTDRNGAMAVVQWAQALRTAEGGLRWSVRDKAGAFVGTAGFSGIRRERACRGELAYDVARRHWRQGVGTEVLAAVVPFGFAVLGLRRIEAMVTPGNVASCALLERCGFCREGTLKDYAFWKGRYWDQHIYARIADAA